MKTALIATLVLIAGFASWAGPHTFTYRGALRDARGGIIKGDDGKVKQAHQVEVRLYNAATKGDLLWGRTFNVLTDEQGVFSLVVTDSAGSEIVEASLRDVFSKAQPGALFLGLTVVGSSGEIMPRQCVYSAPFAAMADDTRLASGDFTVSGSLIVLGADGVTTNVVISKNGFSQKNGLFDVPSIVVRNPVRAMEIVAGDGMLTASGDGVTVKDHPLDVTNTQIRVNGSDVVPFPVGGIITWTKKELPDNTHWAVCDGSNGTPDLRDRFIAGVGGTYSLGNTGGEEKHALTQDELPSHKHAFSEWSWTGYMSYDQKQYQESLAPKSSDSSHYTPGHAISIDAAGGDVAHENRPPYYALYYIMRIK